MNAPLTARCVEVLTAAGFVAGAPAGAGPLEPGWAAFTAPDGRFAVVTGDAGFELYAAGAVALDYFAGYGLPEGVRPETLHVGGYGPEALAAALARFPA